MWLYCIIHLHSLFKRNACRRFLKSSDRNFLLWLLCSNSLTWRLKVLSMTTQLVVLSNIVLSNGVLSDCLFWNENVYRTDCESSRGPKRGASGDGFGAERGTVSENWRLHSDLQFSIPLPCDYQRRGESSITPTYRAGIEKRSQALHPGTFLPFDQKQFAEQNR